MIAIAVPARNPGPMTGEGNLTWLVPGDRAVLVDAGVGVSDHVDALRGAVGDAGATLGTLVITHAHADHIAGAPVIHREWPGAAVVKHPWPEVDSRYAVHAAPVADLDRIPSPAGDLVVLHTPGHSPDHICLWHEPSRTLFGGDLLIEGGTVVIPATRGGRLADYMRSLERILALDPAVVLPAHGHVIGRPRSVIEAYLAHRRRREGQVLEALARGGGTPRGLAAMIYDDLPESLRRMGEESVLAHLMKLVDEGRATSDGDEYRLTT